MRNRLLGLLASFVALAGCSDGRRQAAFVSGGDPDRGAAAIGKYGCNSCHIIEGIQGPSGQVATPLTGFRTRMYVAGVAENTPENLVRWIRDPRAIDEKTAMPNLGVSTQDATDIAAYLYSIQ